MKRRGFFGALLGAPAVAAAAVQEPPKERSVKEIANELFAAAARSGGQADVWTHPGGSAVVMSKWEKVNTAVTMTAESQETK